MCQRYQRDGRDSKPNRRGEKKNNNPPQQRNCELMNSPTVSLQTLILLLWLSRRRSRHYRRAFVLPAFSFLCSCCPSFFSLSVLEGSVSHFQNATSLQSHWCALVTWRTPVCHACLSVSGLGPSSRQIQNGVHIGSLVLTFSSLNDNITLGPFGECSWLGCAGKVSYLEVSALSKRLLR